MNFQNPPDAVIHDLLGQPRRIAVVGCSPDPTRDSHRIARLLVARGHEVLPVNPSATSLLGRRCYAGLRDIEGHIDIVDVFRRPDQLSGIVDDAIALEAGVLWLQLGVINEGEAQRARAAGLTVIMDRCPAIEYQRLFGLAHEVDPS